MKRIAVIGGGITGLSVAHLLRNDADVVVFERADTVGGLIRCDRVEGSLFHTCGGHVFNTKNRAVSDWFWNIFNRDRDFVKAGRKSAVCMDDGRFVDYPIENHVYQFDESTISGFVCDMVKLASGAEVKSDNFSDFLRNQFGETLYRLYFEPYNAKVWRRSLTEVPIEWLAGKLPMPSVHEMLEANIARQEEHGFVHSSFYYPRKGGSQFIADSLSAGSQIVLGHGVRQIQLLQGGRVRVDGDDFDVVVFCGNLKDLPSMVEGYDLSAFGNGIAALESHGTTAVFCETEPIPYSWFYQPSPRHDSHRFICTGNFAPSNNADGKMTCTVEFTDAIERDEIERQLQLMPYRPRYLTHHYSRYTYPIQHKDTRSFIADLKARLSVHKIYLAGRFAEWEYYNMDAAMDAAMAVCEHVTAEVLQNAAH